MVIQCLGTCLLTQGMQVQSLVCVSKDSHNQIFKSRQTPEAKYGARVEARWKG